MLWSSFTAFWIITGCIFVIWLITFSLLTNLRPITLKITPVLFTVAILTAMFVWGYLSLHTTLLSRLVTSSSLLTLQSSPTLNPVLFVGLLTPEVYPLLLITILVTSTSLVFCLAYNQAEVGAFVSYLGIIFLAAFFFFSSTSIISFFLAYEMFLVPSFLILYKFAKTRRAIEAAYLMFFWTQFGALFLIFSFSFLFLTTSSSWDNIHSYSFSPWEGVFLTICWFIGFGVKLPLWPFYGWLPKAHVEASTNFSIFLSGVLVKFAFFGLFKCLHTLHLDVSCPFVIPFLLVGLVDASFKLFLQIDLKKMVAYATVIEMHWLTICIIGGTSPLLLAGWAMLINHALLSANAFLIVDAINRRFKTRLITEISGLNLLCPKLFILAFINCLLFLGFPGSLSFVSEVLFFTFLIDFSPILALILILFLYVLAPTFFFRSWFNAMFGASQFYSKQPPSDLTRREFTSIASLEFLIYYLGLTWQTLCF